MKINILSSNFKYPNVRSFLYPLIKFRKYFKSNGFNFVFNPKKICKDCDVIFIESNFYGQRWKNEENNILEEIADLKKKIGKVIYFDTSDSTSLLNPNVINHIDKYCKGQILKDKTEYKKKFYGNRIFTDFCKKKYNIVDDDISYSAPVKTQKEIEKIDIFWNSSISNYSILGKVMNECYNYFPIKQMLFPPQKKINKTKDREIFFRMNMKYSRMTVQWHREQAEKKLNLNNECSRINVFQYFNELSRSKVSISPFGWGEINYRDFETFLCGSLLIKPKMNHLKTWPNFYRDGTDLITYDWSCNDLHKKVSEIINNYNQFKHIAINGQKNYIDFLKNKDLKEKILIKLKNIIE
jgi:hypothetical protein